MNAARPPHRVQSPQRRPGLRPAPPRGAALMIALVLMTVVATLASGMVWQQWRAVQVETAERSRVQSAWMLYGALDYARLILREDARINNPTNLSDPWATPLAETKISTMLAVDRSNNADSNDTEGVQAFISGSIADAQARYNLRQVLAADGKVLPEQVAVLARLCTTAGLPTDVAPRLAEQLRLAVQGSEANAPLLPQTLDDLGWLGLSEDTINRLRPLLVLLPVATPVNVNTASREVLAAVIPGLDLGSADRLVQARSKGFFTKLDDVKTVLGQSVTLVPQNLEVRSSFFEVEGRMRLEDRLLSERYLVQRRPGLDIRAIARLRRSALLGAAAPGG